ncbi:hypothetical protein SUGI_0473120 [Cryptomeria japonica]|uniref:uncharacterized protein LOC131072722 n=1 Tax=Cryptomeria japonica TaxID=3369 RepID=UPI002408975E|nr:uncharacterized protein LOC131072722 [Cryptomeria japonica]GLJ24750.1 hypothetical protein SUGI_0473120 [Cryptomeria japonica]
MAHILQQILFQSPPSLYLKATGILTLIGGFNAAYSEVKGTNLTYSKFAKTIEVKQAKKVSSRNGMLICYGPASVASSAFLLSKLGYIGSTGPHLLTLASALTIHFLKRELEVLFLHRYSGDMPLQTALLISFSYFFQTVNLLYAQQLSEGMRPPGRDLMWVGVVLFCIGIGGNLYHHYLLSKLRKDGKTGYVVPSGGLFDLVVCPHYLFEIVDWIGLAFISQTLYSWASVVWTVIYLAGRSYATRQWYLQKMENFPKQRKALFPFIF